MKELIFTTVNHNDLQEMIDAAIGRAIERMMPIPKDDSKSEFMSGNEVDEYLKISAVTRHKYAKKGILIKHRIGGRVLYRRDEVEKALKSIQTKKR